MTCVASVRRLRRSVVTLAMFGGLLMAWAPAAEAQNDRNPYIRRTASPGTDQRSKAVLDLLEQLQREELNSRGTSQPAIAPMNRGIEAQPYAVPNIQENDLRVIQRALEDFASEADRLTSSLSEDSRRVPGVRTAIGDLLKIRARSSLLAQQARTVRDFTQILPDVQQLDQSWRFVSHNLSQLRGLSRESLTAIQRMDSDVKAFAKVIQLDPQIDRTELLRQTASLSTGLYTLIDNVEIELGNSQAARELLLELRKVDQLVRYLSMSISDRRAYKEIVRDYEEYSNLWSKTLVKIWATQNRYLERDVRRIQEIDSRVRSQLLIADKVNHQELLHLTNVLKRDVDEFFLRAPLKLLIELPRGTEVIPTADMFYGVCQHFTDVVERGEDISELTDAYGYIEDSWKEFHTIFRDMKSQAALHVLQQIEKSVLALQSELGVQDSFNRKEAINLAASLEMLSQHLETDVNNWLKNDRPSFRTEAYREVHAFSDGCARLHTLLNQNADLRRIQQESDNLLDTWQRAYNYVARCRTADRPYLLRHASRIMPNLLEMQSLVVK